MLKATTIAKYILNKDPDHKLFNKNLITKNHRTFYDGSARLNKYLHLMQVVYLAKNGSLLFEEDMYAYDNGGVVTEVQENFSVLYGLNKPLSDEIDDETKKYIDKMCVALESASTDDLISLSHEDEEWQVKHNYYQKKDQKMDLLSRRQEYEAQYADFINVLDRMVL